MTAKSKTYYKNKLNAYYSKEIRSIGRCQWCGKTNARFEMAHIISRSNQTLRFDENNLLCLCTTCHFKAHHDPLEFTEFIKKDFPERYRYLMANKNNLTKRSVKDLKMMYEMTGGE